MSVNGDSLILAGQLELLGGAGATYNVVDGQRQLGDPQAVTQIVRAQLTMGSYVTGDFTDNRAINLQVAIYAPNRLALAQADSVLRQIVNASLPTTLQYTPHGGLPIVFDVFRGQVKTPWSRKFEAAGWRIVTIGMLAFPFGRSTVQRVIAGSSSSVQLGNFAQSTEYAYAIPDINDNTVYGNPADITAVATPITGNAYPEVTTAPQPIDGGGSMQLSLGTFYHYGFATRGIYGVTSVMAKVGPVSGSWNLANTTHLTLGVAVPDDSPENIQVNVRLGDSHGVFQTFTGFVTFTPRGTAAWQYTTIDLSDNDVDLTAITSWTLWISVYDWNVGAGSFYYLGMLRAYSDVASAAATTNGAVYKLGGVLGDARAPATIQIARGTNLLTAGDASFESGTGSWVQIASSCTLSQSTTQALDGTHSMRMSAASTTMNAQLVVRIPVSGGLTYTASASFRAGTTGRLCFINATWVDALGNNVGNMGGGTAGTTVNDTNSGWTRAHVTAVAPETAVAAILTIEIDAGGFGELHYVDEVMFAVGTSSTFSVGTPWPTITGFLAYRAPAGTSINTPSLLGVVSGHATSLAPTTLAGTYRVIGVNSSNITAGASMTVTQKVGATTVATATLTSAAVAGGTHWGDFGDITLPLIDVPTQATNVTYDFAFTGTDLILADTRGFLVWVPTMTAAPYVWIDEATPAGMGDVFAGTAPDRSDATSLLGLTGVQVSGAMSLDPGDDNFILAYAVDGVPANLEVSYFDRYLGERTAA